jgi:hypothetical protein
VIEVAIIDSGLTAEHPHLQGLQVRGFALVGHAEPLIRADDFSDVTGHGTAVAAAFHRLAPGTPLLCIRLLDADLRTTTEALCAGIRAAAEEGARVINLSLGSGRAEAAEPLARAIAEATEAGSVCVAAAHPRGRTLFPADLDTVISVTTHRSCPLADLLVVPGPRPRFLAHGYPRPIEGRQATDNFFGPSFAAVHVASRIARLLNDAPQLGFDDVVAALRRQATGTWEETAP